MANGATNRSLSRAARERRRESIERSTFKSDSGIKALTDFLARADGRARTRAGREPSRDELDESVRFMAVEREVLFNVGGKVTRWTLAEYAANVSPNGRPEIVFALLMDGIATGTWSLDRDTGVFTLHDEIDKTVRDIFRKE